MMADYECRTCSAPIAQPGLCPECSPRVVSAEEIRRNLAEAERESNIELTAEAIGAREAAATAKGAAIAEGRAGRVPSRFARAFLERTANANQTGGDGE